MIDQIFKFIFGLIEAVFGFLFEFIEVLIKGFPQRNREYKADFISPGTLLSSYNKGFCLTGRRNLSAKLSYQNALVIGGTGVGKSSVVLVPSLYTMNSSFIIHDPSGELFSKSAGYLSSRGYEVKVLNFAKPSVSCGYNPLARAHTSSEIQKVASLLVENSLGKGKDPFWTTQSSAVIAMLITILKKQEGSEYQNLYNVRQLLNQLGGNPKAVDDLFSRYADEVLFSEYKSFIAFDEKVVSGVLATCKAALQIFSDEAVAAVTSIDTLDFSSLRKKPVALFIQNSVSEQRYYSVLTSLLFEQFFSYVLGRFPTDKELDIFLLIDEASSLNLPTLPLAVANVRKHRAGIMLLLQDFSQLIHHYGRYDADAIKANCFAKMYFTGQSLETTKELESIMGKYQYEDDRGAKAVRSLMTSDEIRIISEKKALLICGNYPPILTRLKPYYKRFQFKRFATIPPRTLNGNIPDGVIPVLPLNKVGDKEYA